VDDAKTEAELLEKEGQMNLQLAEILKWKVSEAKDVMKSK
jgi:hypothetical protein